MCKEFLYGIFKGKNHINIYNFLNNKNPINILILLIFIYPILKGFMIKFSSKHLKKDVSGVQNNISFLMSIILGIYFMKNIFFNHDKVVYSKIYHLIPRNILNYINHKPIIVYIVAVPIGVFIIHRIIMLILQCLNNITLYPIFDVIERKIKGKSNIAKRILGSIFQVPKAICYVIILSFALNVISMVNISENLNSYLEKSNYYNYVCKQVVIPINNSKLAKRLPSVVNHSFKIVIKKDSNHQKDIPSGKTVIYYNGVTLDQGIKSDEKIDAFARELVKDSKSDREKAEKTYNWIGDNIRYDNAKAEKIFNNVYDVNSGAISTYDSKTGICFDYSCLFVAMCRANGIKVRMITGKGFNGVSWVGHAWNQVYIKEEGEWIDVDTTFAKGGDYFDSKRFMIDHKDGRMAGEW